MEWIIIILVSLVSLSTLPFYIFIYEGIIEWKKKYGVKFDTMNLKYDIDLRVHEDDKRHEYFKKLSCPNFIFDLEHLINKFFIAYPDFEDTEILNNLQIIFQDELYGGFNNSTKAIGSTPAGHRTFNYLKWKNYFTINIDIESIHKKKLDIYELSGLILHEYYHNWLYVHTDSADGGHKNGMWKAIDGWKG